MCCIYHALHLFHVKYINHLWRAGRPSVQLHRGTAVQPCIQYDSDTVDVLTHLWPFKFERDDLKVAILDTSCETSAVAIHDAVYPKMSPTVHVYPTTVLM